MGNTVYPIGFGRYDCEPPQNGHTNCCNSAPVASPTPPVCLGDPNCPGNTCIGNTCTDCNGVIRGGTLDCGGPPTPTPTFAPPAEHPTCQFTGSPPTSGVAGQTLTYSATCTDPDDADLDNMRIYWQPTNLSSPPQEFAFCWLSGGSGSCSGSVSFPAGSYYVSLTGAEFWSGLRCSGDPRCEWEPNPPSTVFCANLGGASYDNCSLDDVVTVTISAPTPTPTRTPTPTPTQAVTVSGGVYDDANPSGFPGPQCTGSLATGVRPTPGSLVRVTPPAGSLTGAVQSNGTYSVGPVPAGIMSLTLENLGGYQCICPTGCRYSNQAITATNQSGWNFFVSALKPVWWKAVGGHVHAQMGLASNIPSGQRLIDDATGNGPGVLTHDQGVSINLGSGTLSSRPGWNFNDALSRSSWRYGYDALYARAGRPTTDPGNGSSPPGTGVFFENGAYTISGTWTGLSGSRVIFVNGDVTINTQISLANASAFLAIIAKGNVSVAPTVGNLSRPMNPTSANASLTGVFLADGDVRGGTNGTGGLTPDRQLVIYGTVGADMDLNGSGIVDGQRNMGIYSGPGVAYVWNPNLILNAPPELFESLTDWREVAP